MPNGDVALPVCLPACLSIESISKEGVEAQSPVASLTCCQAVMVD